MHSIIALYITSGVSTIAEGMVGFGMCDTSQTPALGVMRVVPDRSAVTLLPVIQHVRTGSTVCNNMCVAYVYVHNYKQQPQQSTSTAQLTTLSISSTLKLESIIMSYIAIR